MAGHTHGNRSAVTCHLRCGDACSPAGAQHHRRRVLPRRRRARVLSRRVRRRHRAVCRRRRRAVPWLARPPPRRPRAGPGRPRQARPRLPFTAIAPVAATVDDVTVPEGYRWHPIIRWGDPIFAGAPPSTSTHQTAAAQAGSSATTTTTSTSSRPTAQRPRALLCANHEYTNETIMFPPDHRRRRAGESARVAGRARPLASSSWSAAHTGTPWTLRPGRRLNRRITARHPVHGSTGPAAGSDAAARPRPTRPAARVLGTLGNCAGGTTPWGTILSGEENFNGYFRAARHRPAADKRYGLTNTPTARGWELDRPALRHPHRRLRERAQPLRLDRRGRPVRPDVDAGASTPRWAASSTRAPT